MKTSIRDIVREERRADMRAQFERQAKAIAAAEPHAMNPTRQPHQRELYAGWLRSWELLVLAAHACDHVPVALSRVFEDLR